MKPKDRKQFSQRLKDFLADKDIEVISHEGFSSIPSDNFNLEIKVHYKGEPSSKNHEDFIKFIDSIWDDYE
ncbi:hypothetical protein [Leptospira interrogans]|nr:hypothetical protein [Leptospira interrogans]